MNKMNISTEQLAKQVRKDIVELTYKAGTHGTHISGSLSAVEALSVLYNDILRFNRDNLADESRDRFILSKGHAGMAMYAVMNRIGILSDEDLATFKDDGSAFHTHPKMDVSKGIEFSTGSLGHGLSLGVGTAIALKKRGNFTSRVFVMIGDGECDEGAVWEAAMSAAHFNLDNLIVIIDQNQLQLDGRIVDIMNQGSLADKWKSFGWKVYEMDGHNVADIQKTMTDGLKNLTCPTVFMSHTIKGKGISFIENQYNWHIGVLTQEQYEQAKKELEEV
jgi:transketolase